MKAFVVSASLALLVLGSAGASNAHHAINAQFDTTNEFVATGVLTKFEPISPHPYWHFEIKTPAGATETWSFTSGSPALLRRAGLRVREEIVPGQTFTLHYNTARNGDKIGFIRAVTIRGQRIRLSNS
jgi:hypothetical protein